MLKQLIKNSYNTFFYLIILSLSNIQAQDYQILLKSEFKPSEEGYWWLDKNNSGIKNSNFHFSSMLELNTLKTQYVLTLITSDKKELDFKESFIKHNFSDKTFLRVGKYYRDFSTYLNDDLSSGSMLISHNASPMNKIGLVTSKQWRNLDFNFGMSHGVFDDNNSFYTKDPLLHEKFIYMNRSINNYDISVGLVHEAMWGGGLPDQLGGNQTQNLKNFVKVFFSSDGEKLEGQSHANALGNHLGIWEFFIKKTDKDRITKFYYQHIFEDTSSLRFANRIDGLWGTELINYLPNTTILFEYLDTTNCCIDPPYQNDRYYWNGQYGGGWSYNNYTLGNPFINHLEHELIRVFHVGVHSNIGQNYYQIKAARKINLTDNIKYKVLIGRSMKQNFDIEIMIINNEKNQQKIGLVLSKFL